MSETRKPNYYGRSLTVKIERGELVIRIGVGTLAHAVTNAGWANPYDEEKNDYLRTFAIENADLFARDVAHAMCAEEEDGSTPLQQFIDKMAADAVSDGSEGLYLEEVSIKNGETHPVETWAERLEGR